MAHSIGAQKAKYRSRKRLVKRVQHFEITVASSSATGTATIDAVDTNYSVVFIGWWNSPFTSANLDRNWVRLDLTNTTTVTATRNTSTTHAIVTRGCVVEFYPWAINRLQQGTVTIATATTSGTASITSVDTARSVAFFLSLTTVNSGTSPANVVCGIDLTNATTVTATRSTAASGGCTVGYCVVEFAPGVVKSVQQFTLTSTSSSATDTQTITAVDTRNTLLVYQGYQSAQTSENSMMAWATLTNATTITFTRSGTSTTSRNYYMTALEFAPGYIRQFQQGSTTIASSSTSNQTTISPTIPDRTALVLTGTAPSANTDSNLYSCIRLQDNTTVDADRNTSGSNTVACGWQAVEFL